MVARRAGAARRAGRRPRDPQARDELGPGARAGDPLGVATAVAPRQRGHRLARLCAAGGRVASRRDCDEPAPELPRRGPHLHGLEPRQVSPGEGLGDRRQRAAVPRSRGRSSRGGCCGDRTAGARPGQRRRARRDPVSGDVAELRDSIRDRDGRPGRGGSDRGGDPDLPCSVAGAAATAPGIPPAAHSGSGGRHGWSVPDQPGGLECIRGGVSGTRAGPHPGGPSELEPGHHRVHDFVSCRPRGAVRPRRGRAPRRSVHPPPHRAPGRQARGGIGPGHTGVVDHHRAGRRRAVPVRPQRSHSLSQPKRVTPVATGTLYTPAHPFLVALVLLCLWIVILSLPMWSGKFLAGPWSDQLKAGYAIRYWGAEQWRITGHPPQWNPNLVGGVPVFAGFGDLFYWTAWLRLFLPTVFAMKLAFIIHYLLAAVFMYALLRKFDFTWTSSVLGGTAYQLSGVIITYASPGHDGKLFVTALLPLMLIALVMGIRQRRWEGFALLALAVGLALLSPQYQATQYALIASGIFALYLTFGEPQQLTQRQQWTGLGLAAAGVAVGFGLSLVQVLPFTHYIQHSARSESAGYAWSTSYAMPWIHVPELLLAGFTGAKETYFGPNILKLHSEYLGLPVVALALLGLGSSRRRLAQWTGAMTLLFLLVALGNATPFYRLWYALVPYVNKTRAPGMALYVVSAATAVLAACGTERLERGEGERHAKIYLAAAGIIALLALAGVWGAIGQSYAAAHPEMGNAVGVSAAQAASQAQDGIRWGAFGSAIAPAAPGALVLAARRGAGHPAAVPRAP